LSLFLQKNKKEEKKIMGPKIKINGVDFELRRFLRGWTQEELDDFLKEMHEEVWPLILEKEKQYKKKQWEEQK
jgi:hypothetical protein